jgi:pimeloyl-ACP methyl ester carboxylesterase
MTARRIQANGLNVNVLVGGAGFPVLMIHGFPFTSHVWRNVAPPLIAAGYQVIAPDMRGIGGTDKPSGSYDVNTVADDMVALLDALSVKSANVVAFDLGAPPAFMLGIREPQRVNKLVLMEGMIGQLPGAERFLANGPPWWFGFHNVPGLAETVLQGHEAEYIGWFMSAKPPTHRAVDARAQKVYVQAYAGREGLRGPFEHYRAMSTSAKQINEIVSRQRLVRPTLAIAGGVIGDAVRAQISPHCDNLQSLHMPDVGHNIPEEKPEELAKALLAFF